MIDYERIVDSMLFDARVAMLDGDILEVEPCQFSDCITHVMEKLRQAEKDAARYRWLRDYYRHEYCVDDLFDGGSSSVDNRIDEAMQCNK